MVQLRRADTPMDAARELATGFARIVPVPPPSSSINSMPPQRNRFRLSSAESNADPSVGKNRR